MQVECGIQGVTPGDETVAYLQQQSQAARTIGGLALAALTVAAHLFDSAFQREVGMLRWGASACCSSSALSPTRCARYAGALWIWDGKLDWHQAVLGAPWLSFGLFDLLSPMHRYCYCELD